MVFYFIYMCYHVMSSAFPLYYDVRFFKRRVSEFLKGRKRIGAPLGCRCPWATMSVYQHMACLVVYYIINKKMELEIQIKLILFKNWNMEFTYWIWMLIGNSHRFEKHCSYKEPAQDILKPYYQILVFLHHCKSELQVKWTHLNCNEVALYYLFY